MDEEYGIFTLVVVYYTLRQPPNVIGECRSAGAFIICVYQLRLPLSFSYVGVKYPLESYGAFPYGIHYMVGLCAQAQGVPVGWVA